jgi:pantoate--beta-alanine ligase
MAQTKAEHTVVSIFVNPTQFGPNEDFDNYPRTLEQDLLELENLGVDSVFIPKTTDIYPNGITQATRIYVPEIGQLYCGKSRPGFFEGVCSIVLRLFLLVKPTHAILGEKDFQQLTIIRHMVEDLYLPLEIISAPIVREPSGLAMSSRNKYLTEREKKTASQIYQTLKKMQAEQLSVDPNNSISSAKKRLADIGIETDYLVIINDKTLLEASPEMPPTRILFAGYLGKTRLIDNLALS